MEATSKKLFSILLSVVLVFGFLPIITPSRAQAEPQSAGNVASDVLTSSDEANNDELIVVYNDQALGLDETSAQDAADVGAIEEGSEGSSSAADDKNQGQTLEDIGVVSQEEIVEQSSDQGAVTVVSVDDAVSTEEAIDQLEALPEIAFVQPNYTYSLLTTTVSDPFANLEETSTTDNSSEAENLSEAKNSSEVKQYYLDQTRIFDAWDYSKTDQSVSVAVLDTGVNLAHPDLQNVTNADLAYDVTQNCNLRNADVANNGDANGHGTVVAGVLAAEANNGIGIAGASYNASIVPVKVFDSQDKTTTANLVAAYAYLAQQIEAGNLTNLRVVNMSLGYYSQEASEADEALHRSIQMLLNDYGVLTVCAGGNGDAAGNGREATCYPSDFEECISVVAADKTKTVARFSDMNAAKDIAAPGVDIVSTSANGDYTTSTGTSVAAPQVSASLALMFAAQSSLSANEAKQALLETSEPIDSVDSVGLLNAQAAVADVVGAALDGDEALAGQDQSSDQSSAQGSDQNSAQGFGQSDDETLSQNGNSSQNDLSGIVPDEWGDVEFVDPSQYVENKVSDDAADTSAADENATEESEEATSWRYTNGVKQLVNESATTGEEPGDIHLLDNNVVSWSKVNGNNSVNASGRKVVIDGAKRIGIDVSSYQGKIDWAKVRADGISFAILRCASYSSSKKYHVIDSQFINNVKGARAQGIDLGVYIYSYAHNVSGTTDSAEREAKDTLSFLQKAGLKPNMLALPVYFDMEQEKKEDKTKKPAMEISKLGPAAKKFCDIVSAQGYRPGIYANKNWWDNYLTDSVFKSNNWDRWVARYPTAATVRQGTGVSDTKLWQFSYCGKVNGVAGNVDMDFDFAGYTTHKKVINPGEYIISSKLNSKQVLNIANGSTADSGNLELRQSDGSLPQRFTLSYDDNTGYYTITNSYSGKVLDVKSAVAANKTNVQQYTSNGTLAQKWIITRESNGYKIASAIDPDFVLDVDSAKTANGTNVQIYTSNDTGAQRFDFLQSIPSGTTCAKTLSEGMYSIGTTLTGSSVLDVAGGSDKNSANIQLYQSNNSAAQHFKATYDAKTGYYTFISERSGKALDVKSAAAKDGTNVQQYDANNTNAQKWIVSKESNGTYRISSAINLSYTLDVAGAKTANGTNVQIYTANRTNAQKFKFNKISPYGKTIEPGVYEIKSALASNKVLDVSGASKLDGGNIQLYEANGTDAQKFRLAYDSSTGYYTITNVGSGKVVDDSSAKTENYNNVHQYQSNNTLAQRWIIQSLGGGNYRIASALNPEYVLDISGAHTTNGTNAQLYESNGTNAQKFAFKKA